MVGVYVRTIAIPELLDLLSAILLSLVAFVCVRRTVYFIEHNEYDESERIL